MALLELVSERPDWLGALGVALTRPPGVPERRGEEDPWKADGAARPPNRPGAVRPDPSGIRPGFMSRLEQCGVRLPSSAFRERIMLRD